MAKVKSKTKSDLDQPSFEQALRELEATVAHLEEGQIGLDESLAEYQKGVKYLRLCYELLEKAEQRVQLLTGDDNEGNPVSEPFEETCEEPLSQKPQRRSQRRSQSKSPPSTEGCGDEEGTDMDAGGTLF